MKTIKNQLKKIMLVLTLIMSTHSYAQKEILKNSIFVRVYNLDGKKMNKGYVAFVGDSILGLKRNGNYVEINVREIGTIKTKRSAGHNLLISTVAGATTGAIFGAVTAEESRDLFGNLYEYESKTITSYLLIGTAAGAAAGGISIAIKNSHTYVINGDLESWRVLNNN